MQKDIERFLKIFQSATNAISSEFMKLPIADMDEPIYRELVYCYELYHCLRREMENLANFPYSLCGELDKSGHPLIRGNSLDKIKPDFLVHKPGQMEKNLVVIEVKPVNAASAAIAKDLKCLTAFCRRAQYFQAVYLIYGEDGENFQRIKETAYSLEKGGDGKIDLGLIHLYWHRSPKSFAERQCWDRS